MVGRGGSQRAAAQQDRRGRSMWLYAAKALHALGRDEEAARILKAVIFQQPGGDPPTRSCATSRAKRSSPGWTSFMRETGSRSGP